MFFLFVTNSFLVRKCFCEVPHHNSLIKCEYYCYYFRLAPCLRMDNEFPPLKVFRTQGFSLSSSRNREQPAHNDRFFLSNLEPVSFSKGQNLCEIGMSRSHCWVVDEDRKFVRIWCYSSFLLNYFHNSHSSCHESLTMSPLLLPIPPVLQSFSNGEFSRIFTSHFSDKYKSIAFCTTSGVVFSLDNCASFQMLALPSDERNKKREVSSFVCCLQEVSDLNCSAFVTVIGMTEGTVIVDLKMDGKHYNCQDTLQFSSHGFFEEKSEADPVNETAEYQRNEKESVSYSKDSTPRRTWWSSVVQAVFPSALHNRIYPQEEKEASFSTVSDAVSLKLDATPNINLNLYTCQDRSCHIVCFRERSQTTVSSQCLELFCATPVGIALYTIEIEQRSSTAPFKCALNLKKKWQTNVVQQLQRPGKILSLGESGNSVGVLFSSEGSSRMLPSLFFIVLEENCGKVVHYTRLNTAPGVINAVLGCPPSYIKVFLGNAKKTSAIICFSDFVMKVNLDPTAKENSCSACSVLSTNKNTINNSHGFLTSFITENGDVVSLSNCGPKITINRVWDTELGCIIDTSPSEKYSFLFHSTDAELKKVFAGDQAGASQLEADQCVKDFLACSAADPNVSLDTIVLEKGMSCYSTAVTSDDDRKVLKDGEAGVNCTLRRVTTLLKRKQRAHRQFLLATVRNKALVSSLRPETLGDLFSAQESLLVLCSLRALQNVRYTPTDPDNTAVLFKKIELSYSDPQSGVALEWSKQDGNLSDSTVLLFYHPQHLLASQAILRQSVLLVAQKYCSEKKLFTPSSAANLVFSHPKFASKLLLAVVQLLNETWSSGSVSYEDKLITSYAVSCIFVVVAQTMLESRNDIANVYLLSTDVYRDCIWTNSCTSTWSIKDTLCRLCLLLSDNWADACSRSSSFLCQQGQRDIVDHLFFLLFFVFSCEKNSLDAHTFFPQMLRRTLLRYPFVEEPYGFPHGPPHFSSSSSLPFGVIITSSGSTVSVPLGLRIIKAAESLALGFNVFEILADFSLSLVVEDPTTFTNSSINENNRKVSLQCPNNDPFVTMSGALNVASPLSFSHYALFVEYCRRNYHFFLFALQYFLSQQREWELVSLPQVLLADIPQAIEQRNRFLEKYAPHLLWVTSPTRFDALLRESISPSAHISYGPNALAHRSRCVALSRLSFIAGGSPTLSTNFGDLELSTEILKAQKKYFSSLSCHEILGAQELAQRLLALQSNVEAWIDAARIATLTRASLCEDLLTQIFRHCKERDEDIFQTFTESVSENEAFDKLFRTAIGQVIQNCPALQSSSILRHVAGRIYPKEGLELLLSWVDSIAEKKI